MQKAFDPDVIYELVRQTRMQMADGGAGSDFEAFVADYPASAWLDDYRRYGGQADDTDAEAIEEAVLDAAFDLDDPR